jgi:hypothetical protein
VFKARADIAELERQPRFDRLVSIEEIKPSWGQLVSNSRTRIIAIPSKAVTRVVGVLTPAACWPSGVRTSGARPHS